MNKYPKIKRLGHRDNDGILDGDEILVQEKMDGANFRFTLQRNIEEEYHDDDRDLVFGSRNVVYKNEKDVDSNFRHAIEYVRENIDLDALRHYDDSWGPLTFYGEAMHSHTLDYDWDNTPSFLGFDMWAGTFEEFAPHNITSMTFNSIGLETVPTLYEGYPEDFDATSVPDSEYRDGVAEGFVIKNHTTEQRAKVRSEEFKEMHAGPSGNTSEEYEPEDGVVLAHKFTTDARVFKMIHKMENEGYDVEMGMMEDLWRRVFDDVIEEEYDTIFLGNHTLDTQQFRSEVASRCARALDTYLSRPDDSVLNEVPA